MVGQTKEENMAVDFEALDLVRTEQSSFLQQESWGAGAAGE